MSALGNDLVVATEYICNFRGGSQPILVQANDGLLYVVKFTNNLQGPNVPFNESMGSELYRACGLAALSWKPVMITDSFLDRNPKCWMQTPEGRLRPAPGLCFGSRFLGMTGVRLREILPAASYKRVRNRDSFWLAWLIDICAGHVDNRQAIFVEDSRGWLDAFFVDHGHIFGGPDGKDLRHFCASRYLDSRIYANISLRETLGFLRVVQSLDADQLWRRLHAIPAEWRRASAMERFVACLQTLSKPALLQHVFEAIIDVQARRTERELGDPRSEGKRPAAVLCPGVRGRTASPSSALAARCSGHLACA